MDRVQRTLGYIGALLLVTGVVITVVGPAQFGIADESAADESAASETAAPVAVASAPDAEESDAPAGGTASTPDDAALDAENRTSPPTDGGANPGDG